MSRVAAPGRMKVVSTVEELRRAGEEARSAGIRYAFVPTMGALHEGHSALVAAGHEVADRVAMSIFVNPLQFGPREDLSTYPRSLEHDTALAEECGVRLLFAPTVQEMYPHESRVRVIPAAMGDLWEGAVRPGHFAGVLTVVLKLLNMLAPRALIMGQKDIQQAVLIRAMCEDLNVPTTVHVVPTVRDADGLALSSRNAYLSGEDRRRALALSRALFRVQEMFAVGERDARVLATEGTAVLNREGGIATDYLVVVDPDGLASLNRPVKRGDIVMVAARVGRTRLIDNTILGER